MTTRIVSSASAPPLTLEQADRAISEANDALHTCSTTLSRSTSRDDLVQLSQRIHKLTSLFTQLRTIPMPTPLLRELLHARVSTIEIQQKLQIARIQTALARQFREEGCAVVYGRVSQYEFPQHPHARTSCVGASAAALSHFLSTSSVTTTETVDCLVEQGIEIHSQILDTQRSQQIELQKQFKAYLIQEILETSHHSGVPLLEDADRTLQAKPVETLIETLVSLRTALNIATEEDQLKSRWQDYTTTLVSHDIDLSTYVPGLTKVGNYTFTPPSGGSRPSNVDIFRRILSEQREFPLGLTLTTRGATVAIIMLRPDHILFFDSHGSPTAVHSPKAYTASFSSIESAAKFLAKSIPLEFHDPKINKEHLFQDTFDRLVEERRIDLGDERALEAITKEAHELTASLIRGLEQEAVARNTLNFSRYKPSLPVTPSAMTSPAPALPAMSTQAVALSSSSSLELQASSSSTSTGTPSLPSLPTPSQVSSVTPTTKTGMSVSLASSSSSSHVPLISGSALTGLPSLSLTPTSSFDPTPSALPAKRAGTTPEGSVAALPKKTSRPRVRFQDEVTASSASSSSSDASLSSQSSRDTALSLAPSLTPATSSASSTSSVMPSSFSTASSSSTATSAPSTPFTRDLNLLITDCLLEFNRINSQYPSHDSFKTLLPLQEEFIQVLIDIKRQGHIQTSDIQRLSRLEEKIGKIEIPSSPKASVLSATQAIIGALRRNGTSSLEVPTLQASILHPLPPTPPVISAGVTPGASLASSSDSSQNRQGVLAFLKRTTSPRTALSSSSSSLLSRSSRDESTSSASSVNTGVISEVDNLILKMDQAINYARKLGLAPTDALFKVLRGFRTTLLHIKNQGHVLPSAIEKLRDLREKINEEHNLASLPHAGAIQASLLSTTQEIIKALNRIASSSTLQASRAKKAGATPGVSLASSSGFSQSRQSVPTLAVSSEAISSVTTPFISEIDDQINYCVSDKVFIKNQGVTEQDSLWKALDAFHNELTKIRNQGHIAASDIQQLNTIQKQINKECNLAISSNRPNAINIRIRLILNTQDIIKALQRMPSSSTPPVTRARVAPGVSLASSLSSDSSRNTVTSSLSSATPAPVTSSSISLSSITSSSANTLFISEVGNLIRHWLRGGIFIKNQGIKQEDSFWKVIGEFYTELTKIKNQGYVNSSNIQSLSSIQEKIIKECNLAISSNRPNAESMKTFLLLTTQEIMEALKRMPSSSSSSSVSALGASTVPPTSPMTPVTKAGIASSSQSSQDSSRATLAVPSEASSSRTLSSSSSSSLSSRSSRDVAASSLTPPPSTPATSSRRISSITPAEFSTALEKLKQKFFEVVYHVKGLGVSSGDNIWALEREFIYKLGNIQTQANVTSSDIQSLREIREKIRAACNEAIGFRKMNAETIKTALLTTTLEIIESLQNLGSRTESTPGLAIPDEVRKRVLLPMLPTRSLAKMTSTDKASNRSKQEGLYYSLVRKQLASLTRISSVSELEEYGLYLGWKRGDGQSALLNKVLPLCTSLTAICLDSNAELSDEACYAIARNCPELTSFSFTGRSGTPSRISERGLSSILFHCKRLATLDLSNCSAVTPYAIGMLSTHNLRELNLYGCSLSDQRSLERVIHQNPYLEKIDIRVGMTHADSMFQAIARCQNLTTLLVNFAEEGNLIAIARGCPQLKIFRTTGSAVNTAVLQAFAQHCPQLETLHIKRNRGLDTTALQALAQCPNLSTLGTDIEWNEDTMRAIASCQNLRNLDIGGRSIDEDNLSIFLTLLPQLRNTLSLYYNHSNILALREIAQQSQHIRFRDRSALPYPDDWL